MSQGAKFEVNIHTPITLEEITRFIQTKKPKVSIHPGTVQQILTGRKVLEEILTSSSQPIYGVNTGFGSLCNVRIPDKDLEQLQVNLIVSHACGTGNLVSDSIVRCILFLKIRSLCYGYSGIRLQTVQLLVDLLNHGIHPLVYEMGSLGASGDLAPLAHISLTLIGKGKARVNGEVMSSSKALQLAGLKPIKLGAKEGLALINGTQFSLAHALVALTQAHAVYQRAQQCAAISHVAFQCLDAPYQPVIQNIRNQKGQIQAAAELLSRIQLEEKQHYGQVQDPYAFRCVPQVHGATFDNLKFHSEILMREANGVTDNPIIDIKKKQVLSGGNFHAQPVALAADQLAIAIAELGSISERRSFQLLSGQRGLPLYLIREAGLNSGMMILQYTAASLVSKNKQLCTPAVIDSITSSNGQEDHVSMAANASVKCVTVVEQVQQVLAIEFLIGMQACDFRKKKELSPTVRKWHQDFRKVISHLDKDRILSDDLQSTLQYFNKSNPVA